MEFEKELQGLAQRYRSEGYHVIVHPQAEQLPPFAKDFGVDILATRGDERTLVQVKQDRADLEADPKVAIEAGITNAQPGWQYDLVVLTKDDPARKVLKDARESTPEQIEQMLAESEKVTQDGALKAGFLVAWAALEAAMRRAAQRTGVGGAIGTPPNLLLREVYTWGYISRDDFARVDEARRLRTAIVHGLAPSFVNADTVHYLVRLARSFLDRSEAIQAAS